MTENQQKKFLSLRQIFCFRGCELHSSFDKWDRDARMMQIGAISLLTAVLYIIFSQLDKKLAPTHIEPLMTLIHLYLVAPVLLLISYLAFTRRSYTLVSTALFLAPLFAAVGNIYIILHLTDYTTYLTEEYLMVFWIFTVSGMTFFYATLNAVIVAAIYIAGSYFYMDDTYLYSMHAFWLLCSFAFGLLGALLFERSKRALFINHRQLHAMAITDNLTGLYNRSKFDEIMPSEIERARRYQTPLGILILDVDHFKAVNDAFGHEKGDQILTGIAEILKKETRATDTLIRWGGEEFVIICPGLVKEQILALAEKLREKVEQHTFESVGTKSLSIGATQYCIEDTPASMIRRADEALYKAKESGRNRALYL